MSGPHPFKNKPEEEFPNEGEGVDTATVAELQDSAVGVLNMRINTMKLRLQNALVDTSGAPEQRRDELQELIASDEGTLESIPVHLKSVFFKKVPDATKTLDEIVTLRQQAAVAMMQLPHDDEEAGSNGAATAL